MRSQNLGINSLVTKLSFEDVLVTFRAVALDLFSDHASDCKVGPGISGLRPAVNQLPPGFLGIRKLPQRLAGGLIFIHFGISPDEDGYQPTLQCRQSLFP